MILWFLTKLKKTVTQTLSAISMSYNFCRSSRQPIASSLSAAVQTVQVERRTSPFNGIERLPRHAIVIKTKSLPVSATTLSLYISHNGRKHKHNPKLSANKHVAQIYLSSLYRLPPIALQTVRRTSPFNGDPQSANGIERSLSRVVVPPSSARLLYHVSNSVVFVHHAGALAKGHPLSKLFSKAEPSPFEKEINVNWVYFSCLKHVNEMVLGDPPQAHQRTQSFHFALPHRPSAITWPCCSSAQATSSLSSHALKHSTGSERVNALGRRAIEVIICMITRDLSVISTDVPGVSLSLSTTHKSH